MAVFEEIPDIYGEVLARYAEQDGTTVATAFANLMDFIQLKEAVFANVLIVVEEPSGYLTDAEGMEELAVLQVYMDTFGEDNAGATVHGYYDAEKLDVLFLKIHYDQEMLVWNLLELFNCKIPGMDVLPDGTLELMYIHDGYNGLQERLQEVFRRLEREGWEEEGHCKAGYYESIYDEEYEEFEEEDGDSPA